MLTEQQRINSLLLVMQPSTRNPFPPQSPCLAKALNRPILSGDDGTP
jgi:hypothetical protein